LVARIEIDIDRLYIYNNDHGSYFGVLFRRTGGPRLPVPLEWAKSALGRIRGGNSPTQ
jgi:hypothetical protein